MNERIGSRFEKLEAVRLAIEARLEGFPTDAIRTPPGPGRWSASQVVGHIILAESRTLDYIRKKSSDPSKLRPAGIKERLKGMLVVAVMKAPIRVRAPEIVASVPDNEDPAELRARWSTLRGELRALLESIPDTLLGTCLFRHPVAGPMTLESALDFMTAHAARHAKQIDRALEQARGDRP